jgi:hypothetical protein
LELFGRRRQHVQVDPPHGPEGLPEHEDRPLVQPLARLDGLPVGREHHRPPELLEHEIQVEAADIRALEEGARHAHEVHLDPIPRELVPQARHEGVGITAQRPGGVDQIDAEQPQGFLLAGRLRVEQASV